jgi:dipeptidase E
MSARPRQIIPIGGGGFGSGPDNPALDLFILEQAGVLSPRVCFIPTATGDDSGYLQSFHEAFSRYDCQRSHLLFFDRTPDLRSVVLNQDVIFVGGGNTRSMLAVWRDWGLVELLREAWQSGTVLAGVSAGAICWFEQGLTDSYSDRLEVLDCLGFLKGSCSPHYDGELERRPSYHRFMKAGTVVPGIALDDGAAAHFVEGELSGVVTSRPNARAYRVVPAGGGVQEIPMDVRYLGNTSS